MTRIEDYTEEQQTKIRQLESTFVRWESEEDHYQRIIDEHEPGRAAAARQRKAAETKLCNYLVECDKLNTELKGDN